LPEAVEGRLGLLAGPRVRLADVHVSHQVAVLGPGGPSVLSRQLAIAVEDGAHPADRAIRRAGRHPAAGRDLEPFVAVGGQQDRRVWLLERPWPDRDALVAEVFSTPRERLPLGPRLDYEVPRLGHAGPRVGERQAVGEKLLRHAPDEARDDAAAGHD